jgi:hypothetical protein
VAEALFDLATLAADVDREGAGAEIGPKKKRAKAASKRGGKENAASGRGGANANANAAVAMPPVGYDGGGGDAREMGYAMPPPGLASARRPFSNNALHVYIAHFIDFTQQVSKQQQRVAAQFSRSIGGGEGAQQQAPGGAPVGGLGPFAGMPPQFGMPPMFNPQLLAAIMSGQMPGAPQQQGQQGQQTTATTQTRDQQQHGSPTPEAQQAQMNQMMNMMMQNFAAFPPMFGPGFMPGVNPMMMPPQQFMPPGFNPAQFMDPNNPMAFMMGGGAGGAGGVPPQLVDAMNAAQQREQQDQKPPQVQQGAAGVKGAPAPFAAA